MSLWFVAAYFSPAGFSTPYRNLLTFARRLRAQGGKLLVIECAFGDKPFAVPDDLADVVLRVRARSVVWQKEALLNHAVTHPPPDCTKVCWADADLLFEDGAVEAIAGSLERFDVVQGFSAVRFLHPGQTDFTATDPSGQPLVEEPGVVAAVAAGGRRGLLGGPARVP